jgi:hypothetical protein
VYISSYARWCVDPSVWATDGQSIQQFLTYYDTVVPTLSSLFGVKAPTPVVIEVTTPNGGVFCDCGPIFGDPASIQIAGNFFSDPFQNPKTGQNIPGFWGYLILVHESINAYTGQIGGGGWPTDWWADDRSPFPNALDVEVLRTIGNQENNSTVQAAGNAQYERFADPSQPNGYDPETGMYVGFFSQYGGFAAYSRFFQLVQNDGIKWPSVSGDTHYTGDNNWSAQLSEYVIAYLSMSFGTTSDLTPTFVNAGVGKLTATMSDGTKIMPYTVDSGAVKTIADAHCSIAAATRNGRNVSSELSALQSGNYKNAVATGGNSSTCPSECSWSQNKCVAKW